MCLVSYTPTRDGYLICSNRDESPKRSHSPLQILNSDEGHILCPQDVKGGSWIICSEQDRACCILNGAFQNHRRKKDYRLSRGLMMREFFNFKSTNAYLYTFDFEKIEPFTMVIKDQNKLLEFRWNGRHKYIKHLETSKIHIWSSITLYPSAIQKLREEKFRELLPNRIPNAQEILRIHSSKILDEKANDFIMNREDRVATISITLIEKSVDSFTVTHNDLRNGGTEQKSIRLN